MTITSIWDHLANRFTYGVEEEPRISQISMQTFPKHHYPEAVDEQEFRKQCQWKGECVKRTDYMLLNITVIFILSVVVTAIMFFSLWQGEVYVLYIALGITVTLVCSALLTVKIHFLLKSMGYNLLFRPKSAAAGTSRSGGKDQASVIAEETADLLVSEVL